MSYAPPTLTILELISFPFMYGIITPSESLIALLTRSSGDPSASGMNSAAILIPSSRSSFVILILSFLCGKCVCGNSQSTTEEGLVNKSLGRQGATA